MSQVTVLTLNGRRSNVKTNPNMTILEVIELACQKQGLNPNEYDLKHHRTILDISSTIRFCGVPNNATLELVETKRPRLESDVKICLQLDNGERLIAEFSPTCCLYEIIERLAPQCLNDNSNPVIIYTRREIIGVEELKATSLRAIGLTRDSAILRLINKKAEELKVQANVSAPLVRQKEKISQVSNDTKVNLEENPPIKTESSALIETNDIEPKTAKSESLTNVEEKEEKEDKKVKGVDEKEKPKIPVFTGTGHVLGGSRPAVSNFVPPEDKKIEKESTKMENLQIGKIHVLGERNAIIYNMEDSPGAVGDDLPDDFFELTLNDARLLLSAAREELQYMENAPLQTASQREFEEKKRVLSLLSTAKHTIIRIKLPDRTVLQAVFAPLDTVADVYEFVKNYLRDSSWEFFLYTTPPKRVLPKEARLVEVDCVPSAIIYLQLLGNCATNSSCLREDLLDKFSCPTAAHMSFSETRMNDKRYLQSRRKCEEADPTEPSVSGLQMNKKLKEDSTVDQPQEKVPKWFKVKK